MLKQTISRFMAEFGPTRKSTKKLDKWEARLDAGIAVERDGASSRSYALVWTPHPGHNETIPPNAVEYAPNEGRHSNAYSLPGLRKGMAALRFKIETPAELDALIAFIRVMPPIRGVA